MKTKHKSSDDLLFGVNNAPDKIIIYIFLCTKFYTEAKLRLKKYKIKTA